MLAIFKHELKTHFQSLTAYVFGTFLLFFAGIYLMIYNLKATVSNFEYVLGSLSMIFIIVVPLLTMRIIAEERKQKTDQLLYSLPLTMTEIVLGKYIALLVVFIIPVLIICIYPLILSQFGNLYYPVIYGTIFAFFLLGACLIAIGMFISSITESQAVAAGLCFVVMLINYYISNLTDYISSSSMGSFLVIAVLILSLVAIFNMMTHNEVIGYGIGIILTLIMCVYSLLSPEGYANILPSIISELSLFERFNIFVNGTFDVTGIVYYSTVIFFFVFLTIQSLEKRRYN